MTLSTAPESAGEREHSDSDRALSSVVLVTAVIAVLALVVRLLVAAAKPLANHDTWFNLSIGHRLWQDWTMVPARGLSRFATSPWIPTQWSSDMLMAKVEDWFGLPGVAWLFGVLQIAFLLTVYKLCRSRTAILPSALAAGATVVAASGMFSARPQIVSLLFFAFALGAWLRTVEDGRARWWLVPLTWLWATAHGLWSLGVVLGAVVCVGLVLDRRHGRATVQLVAVPALCFVVALLTPAGPRLVTSQFAVAGRSSLITEWRPTSFREVASVAVVAMVAVVVVHWSKRGGLSYTSLVFLTLACGMAAMVTRLVPFAAVILAPMVAEALAAVTPPARQTPAQRRFERVALVGGGIVGLLVLALVVPTTATRPANVPDAFTARLERLPHGSSILVEDTIGSWIEWRVPQLSPVIDGLFDAYRVEYMHQFADARAVKPGWQRFVASSGADVGVLVDGSPLTTALRQELGWRSVATDGRWVYLVAPE